MDFVPLTDEIVLSARSIVRTHPETKTRDLAEKFNVRMATLSKAIRGDNYRHLNNIEPPIRRSDKNIELKAEAVRLYTSGMNISQIMSELKVSKSALDCWLCEVRSSETIIPRRDAPLAEFPYQEYRYYHHTDKSGIQNVLLIHDKTRERIHMRYGRYLMSVHLKRKLEHTEMVEHKAGTEYILENLTLKTRFDIRGGEKPIYNKTCKVCGTHFKSGWYATKTCSKECSIKLRVSNRSKPMKVFHKVCAECHKSFETTSNNAKLCSDECRASLKNKRYAIRVSQGRVVRKPQTKSHTAYHNQCVICEEYFYTYKKSEEVCRKKECKDVIAWGTDQ